MEKFSAINLRISCAERGILVPESEASHQMTLVITIADKFIFTVDLFATITFVIAMFFFSTFSISL